MNHVLEIRFTAIDTLYFRGSRPHSAAGASALQSEFPPSVATFIGAVRTRLGDAIGLQWSELREEKGEVYSQSNQTFAGLDAASLIGGSENTGMLAFSEPFIVKQGKRLYSAPAALLATQEGCLRLHLGEPVETDLGKVRLPELPAGVATAKPLEDTWLTHAGMQRFLNGKLPEKEDIVALTDLTAFESRLGIGRNIMAATVEAGLLYQTEHLRLKDDVSFAVKVSLPVKAADVLTQSIEHHPLQRFGGEGRMVALSVESADSPELSLLAPKAPNALVLITDMLPDRVAGPVPLLGFVATRHQGIDCWEGELHGIAVRIISMASGKAIKRGGWDIRHNRPRSVQTFVPAGTCFYAEAINAADSLCKLHGKQIGRRTDSGYGTLVCAAI